MKLKHFLPAIAAVLMTFAFTSCNDDSDPEVRWSNIVTYQGMENGYSIVTWQQEMDAQPVNLRLAYNISQLESGGNTPIGTRIFVEFYTPANVTTLTDNQIIPAESLSQIMALKTLNPVYETQLPPEDWTNEPRQFITTIYRSGTYINMSSILPANTTSTDMTMTFYVDPATLASETVVAYLSYTNPAAVSGATLSYTYFNCINIAALMNGTAQNLLINFNNDNAAVNQYLPYGSVAPNYQSVTIPLK